MIYNYHTHTTRCHHAFGSDRAYVEAAIDAGIQILGFSDHVPYPYLEGHPSEVRMSIADVEDYVSSLAALRDEYKRDISIKIGFEAEYIANLWEELHRQLAPYPYDYMILGQHFLFTETPCIYTGRPSDDSAHLIQYVNEVITAIQTGQFTYIAHPDLICFTGDDTIYLREMKRLCDAAKELDIPLEINLNGVYDHRNYPDRRFFALAQSTGNTFVLGRDAHDPQQFADTESLQKALQLANDCGISLLEDVVLRNPRPHS